MNNLKERYNSLEINDRLSVIFLFTGAVLTFAGFVMGLMFEMPLFMVVSHLAIFLICIGIPLILKNNISKATVIALVVVAYIYFPVIYFMNGGIDGPGSLYFVMIIMYFSFYMKKRQLTIATISLIVYYLCIMVVADNNPAMVIPYEEESYRFIDLSVSVALVAMVMSVVAYTSFKGYTDERKIAMELNKELEKQNEILEELTIRDSMTGIYNRRYFMTKLKEEISYSKENGLLVFIMMIDVDHFKNINDTYGHLYGDEVLKKISANIKDSIRSFDIVARYGGEEFVVMLANAEMEDVVKLAERIRLNVEAIEYRHGEQITISIGIGKIKENDMATCLINRADKNMYKAKEMGRNRVIY